MVDKYGQDVWVSDLEQNAAYLRQDLSRYCRDLRSLLLHLRPL